ncbi:unnamed protein product [Candida verbasci]|uniref:Mitochondrial fusion and transport protein UGO1 n=1 Tax=Candida verbasci TaxID=1227364 RepID=A0A9W4U0F7_9ASCO|nr:unnamed protein product [Candida verbasci]
MSSSSSSSNRLDTSQLRPYYNHDTFDAGYSVIYKKGVGLIDTKTGKPITTNLSSNLIDKTINENISSKSPGLIRRTFNKGGPIGLNQSSFSSNNDKNFLSDLEFNEYFDYNNLIETMKNLIYNFIKSYIKVLLSQPLEIVRLVLQVGKFNCNNKKESISKSKRLLNDDTGSTTTTNEENDTYNEQIGIFDDEETINYFESQNDQSVWRNNNENNNNDFNSQQSNKSNKPKSKRRSLRSNKIQPKSLHTLEILSSIVNKDGPLALFRGINASFIYQTLSHTIEAWITGFISPFLGIPDPFFLDLTHSNDPFKSLWLSVSACILTGVILMPLDLIRIKFMITQFSSSSSIKKQNHSEENISESIEELEESFIQNTRSVRESIKNFPIHYLIHPSSSILLLTTLYQLSTSIFRKMCPYLLFIKFNIDSYSSPNFFTFVNLISLILEFFVKLPVENLLRKAQIKFLITPKKEDHKKVITIENSNENLIVDINDINDEIHENLTFWGKIKTLGLFNGWRVGVLNVIGFWGYNIIKSNNYEFKEERL